MPFDPLAESVCDSLPTVINVLTQLFFKLASQSQSAASLQRPKITATEYDALLACTLDMLERRLGREVTIEQAKKVCMSNIGERNLGRVVALMLTDAR